MLNNFKLVDLTHSLSPDIPTWEGSCGFCSEVKKDYDEMFRVENYTMVAGIGTHMDAPAHLIPKGLPIAEIPLEQLFVSAFVLDVSKQAHPDYLVTAKDIIQFEKDHGRIAVNSLFIAYTGWSRRWPGVEYRNADESGKLHFPAYSAEAAECLLERHISGIGIDTLSPDCSDSSYPVHHLILGAGKYILENLTNLHLIPPAGAYVIALPMKIAGGPESAVRAVGLINIAEVDEVD